MNDNTTIILVDQIEPLIHEIRNEAVMLDSDLAVLFDVTTKNLNKAVKRNQLRFPADFCFQLTDEESESLRCQIGISKKGRGGRRYNPYAFTEHGAIMAATVLNSPRAVEVSVFVVRAFVKLRAFISSHKDLAKKLAELEKKVGSHDESIRQIVATIRQLMTPPSAPKPKRRIGFHQAGE